MIETEPHATTFPLYAPTRREFSLALLASLGAGAALPTAGAPVVRASVALFDFAIAGAGYYHLNSVLHRLTPGMELALLREPKNPL